ncbi:MAG: replication/maintenance protein RepL [Piscirickettsiaceae bacterium]|nr:replication/maintenance protein RepL [Piscirickettsiaceae bacterium]
MPEQRNVKTNEVVATQQEIINSTGLSKKTIQDTCKALKVSNVIIKIRNGRRQLSPNFIWQGNNDNRMDIPLT